MFAAARARIVVVQKILGLFDRRERGLLALLLGLMIVGAGLEVIGIGAVTAFIAIVAEPELAATHRITGWMVSLFGSASAPASLAWAGLTLFAVIAVKNAYLAYLAYRQIRFAFNKESRLARQLLEGYLREPYLFFVQRNSAQLMRNVTHEVSHVITGVVQPGLTVVAECVVLIFILSMLAAVEPLVALVVGVILGSTGLVFVQAVKPVLARSGRERFRTSEERIRWVNQALGSVKEVKLVGCENFFVDAFDKASHRYARSGFIANSLNSLPRLIMETVAVGSLLIAVVIGLNRGEALQSILPTLALFGLAAMRIMPSINRIAPAVNQMRFWLPAVETVHDALDAAELATSEIRWEESEDLRGTKLLEHELAAEDLWFKYPSGAGWAIQGVSLRIPRGASVAFMGASGAGKSTLVDLLLGLTDPARGRILLDGRPIHELRRKWQRHIGYVPQTIYLLDDSVRRNVALGLPDEAIEDERVWGVLRQARLDKVVERLAGGLDAVVGERGMRLSGGERQRLGIARALYRSPEVLVFDEATSALDGQTERDVADTIRSIAGTQTVLIVAHRITTVVGCDSILFLRDGKIADHGTFAELVDRNPAFGAMIGDTRAASAA